MSLINKLCKTCSKYFETQEELEAHELEKLCKRNYSCPFCDNDFQFRCRLARHLINKSICKKPEQSKECPFCLNKFVQSGAMMKHVRFHCDVLDNALQNKTICSILIDKINKFDEENTLKINTQDTSTTVEKLPKKKITKKIGKTLEEIFEEKVKEVFGDDV
jgi:hypothetical protein